MQNEPICWWCGEKLPRRSVLFVPKHRQNEYHPAWQVACVECFDDLFPNTDAVEILLEDVAARPAVPNRPQPPASEQDVPFP